MVYKTIYATDMGINMPTNTRAHTQTKKQHNQFTERKNAPAKTFEKLFLYVS